MDEQEGGVKYFPTVGDGTGLAQTDSLYKEELQLALRNRGMPLEGLRYPITPSGLHYLLIHYDIPDVNADEWRLKVGGQVSRPFDLTLEEIQKRPSQSIAVTMECAGNGRGWTGSRLWRNHFRDTRWCGPIVTRKWRTIREIRSARSGCAR